MFQTYSVKGFFEAMAPLSHPTLTLAHRFVESQAGLAYYAKRPDGLMWRRKELFDAPIYYLAFHGRPGTLVSPLGSIGAEPVIEAFADYGRGYRNLAYFACCNVLRGEKGPRREAVILNAGAALLVAGVADDLRGSVDRAREAIDSGAAGKVLDNLRRFR